MNPLSHLRPPRPQPLHGNPISREGAGRRKLAPGEKLKVLVVDDSVVVRRVVTDAISSHPAMEVVGFASNGAIALQRLGQLRPHVIILDIEMPEMDGIATLQQIRREYRDLVVIMFSSLTARGAQVTMDCLALGADDYITKATGASNTQEGTARLREELLQHIAQFFPSIQAQKAPAIHKPAQARVVPPQAPRVLAIGVSTGGPSALPDVLTVLPANFRLPILITQHMPPMFTRLLAERLDQQCQIRVVEAEAGMPVEAGTAYIAPGNYHLTVQMQGPRIITALNQDAPENSCRPAVDTMFRSIANVYGGGVVATILTGMGQDGMEGCRILRNLGAWVIAQDEESSVVWGMPGAVAKAGLADVITPLGDVAAQILSRVAR
jgi:two-component system, chemotaxis family, protein-glutamate methylesterase/glutaminase